ncbi:hypothetical protein MtrunA17_Chr3g0116931 [Medicago truncatula]|uniref:Transmembrane protein, putative n=1 Tax=Medicago truncatula TaxID=3880 RepID=G7J4A7_MEDTR|nr:transmembrane protein, putative [Medicago truncatula]RHN68720.1 hypothetical protein MtrunA17_Chr3g0116931 [Medicago truncatula]
MIMLKLKNVLFYILSYQSQHGSSLPSLCTTHIFIFLIIIISSSMQYLPSLIWELKISIN